MILNPKEWTTQFFFFISCSACLKNVVSLQRLLRKPACRNCFPPKKSLPSPTKSACAVYSDFPLKIQMALTRWTKAQLLSKRVFRLESFCRVDLAANSLRNKSAKAIMCLGERIHHKVAKEFLKPRNKSQQLHGISLNFGSPTHAKATVISLRDYLNSPLHLVLQDNVAHKQPTSVSSGLKLTTDEATITGGSSNTYNRGNEVLDGQTDDQECENVLT